MSLCLFFVSQYLILSTKLLYPSLYLLSYSYTLSSTPTTLSITVSIFHRRLLLHFHHPIHSINMFPPCFHLCLLPLRPIHLSQYTIHSTIYSVTVISSTLLLLSILLSLHRIYSIKQCYSLFPSSSLFPFIPSFLSRHYNKVLSLIPSTLYLYAPFSSSSSIHSIKPLSPFYSLPFPSRSLPPLPSPYVKKRTIPFMFLFPSSLKASNLLNKTV